MIKKTIIYCFIVLLSTSSTFSNSLADYRNSYEFQEIVRLEKTLVSELLKENNLSKVESILANCNSNAEGAIFGTSQILFNSDNKRLMTLLNRIGKNYEFVFEKYNFNYNEVGLLEFYQAKNIMIFEQLSNEFYFRPCAGCASAATACMNGVSTGVTWGGAALAVLQVAACQAAYYQCSLSCETAQIPIKANQ